MIPFLPASLPDLFASAVFQAEVLLPLVLIVLDVITGIVSAVKRGVFDWTSLGNFLARDILKYMGCVFLILFALLFQSSVVAETLFTTAGMGVLGASVVASIYTNIHEIFPPALIPTIDTMAKDAGLPPDPLPLPLPLPQTVQKPTFAFTNPGVVQPLPVESWTTMKDPMVRQP